MTSLLNNFMSSHEAYNSIFHRLSRPVADAFGLKNLGPHFDVVVYSFILFNLAYTVFVPAFSRLFFNRIYGALDGRSRNKWCVTLPRIHSRVEPPIPHGLETDGGGKYLDFPRARGPRLGFDPRN